MKVLSLYQNQLADAPKSINTVNSILCCMPFTPLHLGPALMVGLPLRKLVHLPTFLVANIILDIEPLLVLYLGLNLPLHGFLHTFLSALAVGLLLGFAMYSLERHLTGFYLKLELETNKVLPLKSFLIAGVFGTALHVVLDALIYSEMQPFFPLNLNPFLSFNVSSLSVYLSCFWLCIFGALYYIVLFAYSKHKKRKIQLKSNLQPKSTG
ncbi:MAG: hydrolase [Candidatus Bathyarchaeia archaeon]